MFQSAHLREVRSYRRGQTPHRRSFNPRTYERCDPIFRKTATDRRRFNPRTYERCDYGIRAVFIDMSVSIRAPTRGAITDYREDWERDPVSIRAPTRGAMATHSKIRTFRVLTPPLSAQNRRNLGNPFPLSHPCDRSL